jgi:hypothetical protein
MFSAASRPATRILALLIVTGMLAACTGRAGTATNTNTTNDAPQQAAQGDGNAGASTPAATDVPTSAPLAATPTPLPVATAAAAETSTPVAADLAATLAGRWTGTLWQGAGPATFSMILDAQAQGNTLTGKARIEQGTGYGVMSFIATVSPGVVRYAETELLEQSPGSIWCIKSAVLLLSPDNTSMSGQWQGPRCNAGHLTLNRATDAAPTPTPGQ